MRPIAPFAALALAAACAGAHRSPARAACRAEDAIARGLQANVAFILTADSALVPPHDSAFAAARARIGYPRRRPAAPRAALVQDERVCQAAAAALARALAGPPRPARPPSGQVYVVRTDDRYTVLDPGYCYALPHCRLVRVVFDRRWRRRGSYADLD